MAHLGKIGFHFPDRGNPNLDTFDIKFLPAGSTASSINDFQQVNKVYAIPAGVTITSVADLQNYVVWELTNNLIAGNQNVAIEYVPLADTVLGSIAIFSASGNNQTQTTVKVHVIHESGLSVTNGTVSTVQVAEIGNLNGYKHICSSLNNNTLYAGQKYYIIFEGSSSTDFYPAYYYDTAGNYRADITSRGATEIEKYYQVETNPPKFVGIFYNTQHIFSLPADSWFTWGNGYGAGLSKYRLYRRTDVGAQYRFEGVIGYPDNSPEFTYEYAQALVSKSNIGDFIWYCQVTSMSNIVFGDIYTKAKTSGTVYTSSNTIAVDVDDNDNAYYIALYNILYGLTQKTYVITGGGTYYHCRLGGYVMSLKSGYTNNVTENPYTTLPSNPQTGEIYYLSDSISGINTTGVYVYDNGNWTIIGYDNFTNYLNYDEIGVEVLTRVGSNREFLEEVKINNNTVDVPYENQLLFDTETTTTRKYYLEINGRSV